MKTKESRAADRQWFIALWLSFYAFAYEWMVLRPSYARQLGREAVAFGHEINAHYRLRREQMDDVDNYIEGFSAGMFVAAVPDEFRAMVSARRHARLAKQTKTRGWLFRRSQAGRREQEREHV